MYRRLFPDVSTPIKWFAYVEEPSLRCRFTDFLDALPGTRRTKVEARMLAWAAANSWIIVNEKIMHRIQGTDPPVYELKVNQERVLFIRCGNDAIAFAGYTKKDNWSRKDQTALDASLKLAVAAASECGS